MTTVTSETIETEAQKYPAFNYCRKYGETNNLTGELRNGWYLPKMAELYTIYKNKTRIDENLLKAGGDQFDYHYYWSCCQHTDYYNASVLVFVDGASDYYSKDNIDGMTTCSVRAFN